MKNFFGRGYGNCTYVADKSQAEVDRIRTQIKWNLYGLLLQKIKKAWPRKSAFYFLAKYAFCMD